MDNFVEEEYDGILSEGIESNLNALNESTLQFVEEYEVNDVVNEVGGSETENADQRVLLSINAFVDILNIDMKNINNVDVQSYDFCDLEMAYLFYWWYGRVNGFSVRKSKVNRSITGEKLQQSFVCSRQGQREDRGLTQQMRKREQKNETRCGCEAKFRVHVNIQSGRWYVTIFIDHHNHEMLKESECALLPAHRKLNTADILQINNLRKAGIRPPQIFGAFANSSGGYHKIGFRPKDLYNEMDRQRKEELSDATTAVKFLRDLGSRDPLMFVRHTIDSEGRLQHLFWSDGESQLNYEIFGDVVAFNATYRKNKYQCPFVIFSGVNHHNQTIVFATALVCNETEETYVWLLEQLMDVMKGKIPVSVITDGDLAMKNAIKKVFPNAHHRLCAWHLLRNANSNVHIPEFLQSLKKCMLGDFDVDKFEELWCKMVCDFKLEENNWIKELYQKRKMWATAHIRGNFYAGIRTTSRCEAFHSHLGKFVNSNICLADFVEQFQRCLTYFRFREVEADFESNYGDVVLQTTFRLIERSATKQFTKEIFLVLRPMFIRATLLRVTECHEMPSFSIYSIMKYHGRGAVWQVCFCSSPVEFRCSCLRMESYGLPCDHIILLLVYLEFDTIPKCLVLDRWTKGAKDSISGRFVDGSLHWDSHIIARHAHLHFLFREVAELAHRDDDDYNHIVDFLSSEICKLRLKHKDHVQMDNVDTDIVNETIETIENPPVVRTKGSGTNKKSASGPSKRRKQCKKCGQVGHNRRSCIANEENGDMDGDRCIGSTSRGGEDDSERV